MPITKKDLQGALRAQSKELKAYVDGRLDERLGQQTKELKAYAAQQTEALARMIKNGFDEVDKQFASLRAELDVRKTVARHEQKFRKLERAFNTRL